MAGDSDLGWPKYKEFKGSTTDHHHGDGRSSNMRGFKHSLVHFVHPSGHQPWPRPGIQPYCARDSEWIAWIVQEVLGLDLRKITGHGGLHCVTYQPFMIFHEDVFFLIFFFGFNWNLDAKTDFPGQLTRPFCWCTTWGPMLRDSRQSERCVSWFSAHPYHWA